MREQRITELGKAEFGASSANGLHFYKKALKKTSAGSKRIRVCPFEKESKCPFRIREINYSEPKDGCLYALQVGSWNHSNHSYSEKKRGVPGAVKSKIQSPALKERPQAVFSELAKKGVEVDSKMKEKLSSLLFRQKAAASRGGLPKGAERTWGAVEQILDKCERVCLNCLSI